MVDSVRVAALLIIVSFVVEFGWSRARLESETEFDRHIRFILTCVFSLLPPTLPPL